MKPGTAMKLTGRGIEIAIRSQIKAVGPGKSLISGNFVHHSIRVATPDGVIFYVRVVDTIFAITLQSIRRADLLKHRLHSLRDIGIRTLAVTKFSQRHLVYLSARHWRIIKTLTISTNAYTSDAGGPIA